MGKMSTRSRSKIQNKPTSLIGNEGSALNNITNAYKIEPRTKAARKRKMSLELNDNCTKRTKTKRKLSICNTLELVAKNVCNEPTENLNSRERCVSVNKVPVLSTEPQSTTSIPPLPAAMATNVIVHAKVSSSQELNTTTTIKDRNDNDVAEIVQKLSRLREILGTKYANVVDRLQLNFIPPCFKNMEHCRSCHSKKSPKPADANIYQLYKSKVLFSHKSHLNGIKMCEDMCYRNEFPGEELFSSLIQLILTTNDNCELSISSRFVIQEAFILFRNLLAKFPPCWQGIRNTYGNFLISPVDITSIIPGRSNNGTNIYQFVISLLEISMSDNDESGNMPPDILNDSEHLFNYSEWEKKHNIQFFTIHSREEKLDRLFLVLELITRLLELDLAMWLLRHPSNPKKHILNTNEQPLVMKLFEIADCNYKTQLVKQTIKLFVECFCLQYPKEKVEILGRIISVLSVVVNTSETELTTEGIRFPYIGTTTTNFAGEIFKTIDSFLLKKPRTVKNYIHIFECIKVPYIKYLLISQLLCKLSRDHTPMKPLKILKIFHKKQWLEGQLDQKVLVINKIDTNKYPINQRIRKREFCELDIYQQDYLDLLLCGLNAYCDSFDIRSVAQNIFRTEIKQTPVKMNPKIHLKHRKNVNLEDMEKDISQLVQKLKVEVKRIKKEVCPNFQQVVANSDMLLSYREDIKYLMILRESVPKMSKIHHHDFRQWIIFLDNIFLVN